MQNKKLTPKQIARLKEQGSKTKDQPDGMCWNCGKPLPKGRRRFCPDCV